MPNPWKAIFEHAHSRVADRLYAIAFTPRSGSTRLADLLSRSQLLGDPREWFNPRLRRALVTRSGATDLNGYYRYLKLNYRSGRVFGVELIWPHLRMLDEAGAGELLNDIPTWFFLRRRRLIVQAVSMHKATGGGIFHSIQSGDAEAGYDGDAIAAWVLQLADQEFQFLHYFRQHDIEHVPLWYETMSEQNPVEIVASVAGPVGIEPQALASLQPDQLASEHKPLRNSSSDEMIREFRSEHAELVDYWSEHRGSHPAAACLKALPQYRKLLPSPPPRG